MNEPTKYTEYVSPELTKTRVDAQWSRIAERLPPPRRARGPFLQVAGAFAVVAALALVWWWRGSESVWEGSVVASDDAPVNVTLAEGSLIELDPRSEVELLHSGPRAVQLRLSEGSARFDVAKKRMRRFSVQMGPVEVLVTGTQFRLTRVASSGGERVRVDVEEGSVEVRREGADKVVLRAGEHWSTFVARDGNEGDRNGELTRDPQEPGPDEVAIEQEEPAPSEEEEPSSEADAPRRPRRAHDTRMLAAEAFERANVARRAGRLNEAADFYADLVARYPRDRRAALAAFELGRIRMDSLADNRGAVEALERALKLDARRAFAEDALARLVLAEEALGDRRACEQAKSRYLARYPDGVHALHLSERCAAR